MKSGQHMTAVASKRPLQGHGVTDTSWSALAVKGCADDERENEMAQNMERVGEHVSALLSMARDIGTEVDIQNAQIETIAHRVGAIHLRSQINFPFTITYLQTEVVDMRVRNADQKAAHIVRKK